MSIHAPSGDRDLVSYRYRLLPDRACEEIAGTVERLSGYAPASFLEDPALLFDIVHPQEHPAFFVLLAGTTDRARLRWIRADGAAVWVEMTACPVWSEGRLVALTGEICRTDPPPGRCARYRPVCVRLLEDVPEAD